MPRGKVGEPAGHVGEPAVPSGEPAAPTGEPTVPTGEPTVPIAVPAVQVGGPWCRSPGRGCSAEGEHVPGLRIPPPGGVHRASGFQAPFRSSRRRVSTVSFVPSKRRSWSPPGHHAPPPNDLPVCRGLGCRAKRGCPARRHQRLVRRPTYAREASFEVCVLRIVRRSRSPREERAACERQRHAAKGSEIRAQCTAMRARREGTALLTNQWEPGQLRQSCQEPPGKTTSCCLQTVCASWG